MDLWDVTKLLARRWLISLPMLLVTLGCALWIGITTDPDYKDTSHVTLLPPSVRRDPAAGTTQNINPWTTESLIAAVVTRLNSKAQHDALQAEGLSGIWETEPDLHFQDLIAIEVTAHSEEQARATTTRLQQIATEEVTRQQERYKLKPGEEISTIPFDSGENIEPSRSKVIRALVVVMGAGGVLTVAVVLAVDAILRRRAQRRTGTGRARPAQLIMPRNASANSEETTVLSRQNPEPARHNPDPAPPPISMPIAIRTVNPGTLTKSTNGTNGSEETTRISIEKPSAAPAEQRPTRLADLEQLAVHEDATIVLPLSNAPWVSNTGKVGGNGSESGKR
jgi:hypothetical protein